MHAGKDTTCQLLQVQAKMQLRKKKVILKNMQICKKTRDILYKYKHTDMLSHCKYKKHKKIHPKKNGLS